MRRLAATTRQCFTYVTVRLLLARVLTLHAAHCDRPSTTSAMVATRPMAPTVLTMAGAAPMLPFVLPVSASYSAKRDFGAAHCGHS